MEYRIFYPGGDTTVRVYQSANVETYAFSIPHTVSSIQIDPDDNVLNGVAGLKGNARSKSGTEMVSVYPNPNDGHLSFRLLGEAGANLLKEHQEHQPGDPSEVRSADPSKIPPGDPPGSKPADLRVEVFNSMGQMVYAGRFGGCVPWSEYSIELGELDPGICFVRFTYGNRSEIKRIIVE
jgi:hypothetical protein